MHLRPYHPKDLAALADIQLQCDKTDPLACYMAQHTDTYAATHRHTTLRFFRTKLLEAGTVAFVAETDSGDVSPSADPAPAGTVIGWSVWTRHGDSTVASHWQRAGRNALLAIETALDGLQNRYFDFLDPTVNHKHISQVTPIISKPLNQGPYQESWELNGMYVTPSWQRRRVGKMLLQWGLMQAGNERVPVVCNSSSVGFSFYENAGFRSIAAQVFDPYFEPGYQGYHSMVWEPEINTSDETGGGPIAMAETV